MSDAFRAVATSPILWLLLVLMAITMSLELGPNRWIPAVLEAGGMPGILVLVLINGVMAIARYNAHSILARVSPPVLLMAGTGTAGIGLLWLSYAASPSETIAAALLFAIGIALVWPTMMGFVAERVPRAGAPGAARGRSRYVAPGLRGGGFAARGTGSRALSAGEAGH